MNRNNLYDVKDLLNVYTKKLVDIIANIGAKREQVGVAFVILDYVNYFAEIRISKYDIFARFRISYDKMKSISFKRHERFRRVRNSAENERSKLQTKYIKK